MKTLVATLAAASMLFSCTPRDKDKAPSPAKASESAPQAKASVASGHWVKIAKGTSLADSVKAEAAKARAAGKKPILYMGATWCKPCVAIKKYKDDPAMVDAFSGATVLDVDIDDWQDEDWKPIGRAPSAVPVFASLDASGKAIAPKISSDVWGDDIPANMAPPLKKYVASVP